MLICKDCLSEDCNCVCTICNNYQPEINTPEKKTRRKKEAKKTGSAVTCVGRGYPLYTGLTKKRKYKDQQNHQRKKGRLASSSSV